MSIIRVLLLVLQVSRTNTNLRCRVFTSEAERRRSLASLRLLESSILVSIPDFYLCLFKSVTPIVELSVQIESL